MFSQCGGFVITQSKKSFKVFDIYSGRLINKMQDNLACVNSFTVGTGNFNFRKTFKLSRTCETVDFYLRKTFKLSRTCETVDFYSRKTSKSSRSCET